MRLARFLLLLTIPALFSCRERGDESFLDESGGGEIESRPDPNNDRAENPHRGNMRSSMQFLANTAQPQETDHPEKRAAYATDLLLLADCEPAPAQLAVGRDAIFHETCDNLTVIPAQETEEEFSEVAVPISWTVDDPDVLALAFPLGSTGTIVRPYGISDLFDSNGIEPQTILHVCALNSCPNPRPNNCADTVCTELPVVSVANVDGAWTLTGYGFDELPITLLQHGRAFHDPTVGIRRGTVTGSSVSFEAGDYRYDGEIAPDRHSMAGIVTDLLGLKQAGAWSAIRE